MIELRLPYPPSANRYWRTRVVTPKGKPAFVSTYPSEDAKAFKEEVAWMFSQAHKGGPIKGRVSIEYTLHPRLPLDWQKRARKDPNGWEEEVRCIDLDNANKVLLDALKGLAFEDDAWVRRIVSQRGEPQAAPGVAIVIRPMPAAVVQPSLLGDVDEPSQWEHSCLVEGATLIDKGAACPHCGAKEPTA